MTARRVLLIAPDFPPCNLVGVHRVRLFSRHLREFGYEPIVLTLQPDEYETKLDPELERLVDPTVEVIRTPAIPIRPVRLFGDTALRSFPYHLAAIDRLVRTRKIDLLFLSVLPAYSSLLGPIVSRRYNIPYVIDYQDPWVQPFQRTHWRSPKSLAVHTLSRVLEPRAVSRAAGVMGVSDGYFAGVVNRNPRLRSLPTAGIPLGGEPLDHETVSRRTDRSRLLNRPELVGRVVLVYAGAILPRAHDTLRTLLSSCRKWIESGDLVAKSVTLLFVGTGSRPTDTNSGIVAPIAKECGAEQFVVEIADRQPFLDVLHLLHQCHGVLILGSSERHYSASKSFQALMSRRPVLGLMHAESTAVGFLRDQPGVSVVTYTDMEPVGVREREVIIGLKSIASATSEPIPRSEDSLEPYTARSMTRRLAAFFDDVLARMNWSRR